MTLFEILAVLFAAGMSGGLVNAILADRGLVLPKLERLGDQTLILRLGFVGNVVIGGFAALMIGGLYGPMSAMEVSGATIRLHMSFASLAAAILTGAAGARVFSQEIEKRYTRASQRRVEKSLMQTTDDSHVKPKRN